MQYEPMFQQLHGQSPRDSFLPLNRNSSEIIQRLQKRWSNPANGDNNNDLKKHINKPSKISEPVKETTKEDEKPKEECKTKKAKQEKQKPKAPVVYKNWEFGKPKSFVPPKSNKRNNQAATQIQKVARGGWQRLRFKIMMLEHKLGTKHERTAHAIGKVDKRTEQRKEAMRHRMEEQAKKESEKITTEQKAAQEGQKIIAYLRKENKKLREKNEKIYSAIYALKEQNARLEEANESTGESFSTLNDHAKQIDETHEKLQVIVPRYKESVEKLRDAVEVRRQFCLAEHKIKLMYVKCVGTLVEMVEDGCKDIKLVDEVVKYCIDMEAEDNAQTLPAKLDQEETEYGDEDEDVSECDSIDEYTVATLED